MTGVMRILASPGEVAVYSAPHPVTEADRRLAQLLLASGMANLSVEMAWASVADTWTLEDYLRDVAPERTRWPDEVWDRLGWALRVGLVALINEREPYHRG